MNTIKILNECKSYYYIKGNFYEIIEELCLFYSEKDPIRIYTGSKFEIILYDEENKPTKYNKSYEISEKILRNKKIIKDVLLNNKNSEFKRLKNSKGKYKHVLLISKQKLDKIDNKYN